MATPWRLARSMTGPYNGGQWARSLAGRRYHSEAHEPPPGPFSLAEKMILNASLPHVPAHGFTDKALVMGAKDVGYLDASINLFSRRAFDLVHHHLVTHRLALKDVAHHHWPAHGGSRGLGDGSDIASRVRRLTWERLMASRAVIHQWQDALAIMAQPANIPTSMAELARLSDEIWYLAGDTSADTSWYSKRAGLSAIYASTELYMTQDKSSDFSDTRRFLERRMKDISSLGTGMSNVGDWLGFTGHALTNVLRSKGARI